MLVHRPNNSLMTLPLATFTAENGLAWFYDKSAIGFAELDKCRRLLGPLPDFDVGDKGYEGIVALGRRVFLIRCANAKAWDFRGRDATYITVTWLDRDKVEDVNLEAILSSDGMCEQSHNYKYSFDGPMSGARAEDGMAQGVDLSRIEDDDVFIRRDLDGKNLWCGGSSCEKHHHLAYCDDHSFFGCPDHLSIWLYQYPGFHRPGFECCRCQRFFYRSTFLHHSQQYVPVDFYQCWFSCLWYVVV